jgi:succinate-semialdehyde dehydrogenase / glutarate-semialdehyde dehydrogenase
MTMNNTSPSKTIHALFDALNDPSLLKTDGLIDGHWVRGSGRFDVVDPATDSRLADVANLGADEAVLAIEAAGRAWPAWRARTAKDRAGLLQKWFALILARIITAEQGKPLAEAAGEVAYGASFVEWFSEEARRTYGEVIPTTDNNKTYVVIRQPIGVCAAITPWNFPLAMITRKVAPALAAGCPVVIKPAEQTPLTALALAELAVRAGIPGGVLNVVPADRQNSVAVGRQLCESETVRHLSFTGSTEVGRILMRQCAPTIKKLALELGGNAPFIVFDDADIDSAVEGAVLAKYRNGGQTCVCVNRFYAQDGIHDQFVAKLAERVKTIRVGNGFEAGVTQGPLIDDDAVAKVQLHVDNARSLGATIVTGGKSLGGRLFEPTVLSGVTHDMQCAKEETFGPVAPVFRFKTEEEAIAMANDSNVGLASYFYTRDVGRVFRVAEALEAGMVGINTGAISTPEVPFGGIKQSGLGREGARQGMEEYLELKHMCIAGKTAT